MFEWPKLFDSFKTVFRFEGRNQKQNIENSTNVVASQSKGAPANSTLVAQVVVERHGYARTPTALFGDFDHAIRNYMEQGAPTSPPALLVTDWDIMIIQMLFRDNDPLRDRLKIINGAITYNGIPLKHPTAGVLQMTER
jgi:hypothetical protein